MENKFFTFIKPYLAFIDSGDLFRKPFRWVYLLIALANLVFPLYVLYQAMNENIFSFEGRYVFVFFLVWLVICFAGWISFQIWWDRSSKINILNIQDNEYPATAMFSNFIQTTGEWFGTWVGLAGFLSVLIITVFLGSEGNFLFSLIGLDMIKTGIMSIILMPVYGFLIMVIARFIAEQARAITAIAKNTKKE